MLLPFVEFSKISGLRLNNQPISMLLHGNFQSLLAVSNTGYRETHKFLFLVIRTSFGSFGQLRRW